MSLAQYSKKRNLSKSGEPKGKISKSKSKKLLRFHRRQLEIAQPQLEGKSKKTARLFSFVVHKHHASHLHWDLRLEIDGVLKSWAIPKIPPTAKTEKRLAIQVEDHPLDYAKFRGIIPEGNYGAGKVEIWDKGTYELESKKLDKIVFSLKGKKLKGKYVLIKTDYAKNSWLFMKV